MKKNYYENQNLYQLKQNNYNFLDLHSDSTYITKKTIKLIFDALIFEIDKDKIVYVIKKFMTFCNSDIKFLMKLECKILHYFLVNCIITEYTFDIILQFYMLNIRKLQKHNLVNKNIEFYTKNFYNYYIAKRIDNNYSFDVRIQEDDINEHNTELFIDLYSKISTSNLDSQEVDLYFASFKDKRLLDSLYKQRIENKKSKTN